MSENLPIQPSPADANGRDQAGRFLPGNSAGKGNPHARRAAKLRSALLKAVTADDIAQIAERLASDAKAGDVSSAKVLFDRLFGRPEASIHVDDARERLAEKIVVYLPDNGRNAHLED